MDEWSRVILQGYSDKCLSIPQLIKTLNTYKHVGFEAVSNIKVSVLLTVLSYKLSGFGLGLVNGFRHF